MQTCDDADWPFAWDEVVSFSPAYNRLYAIKKCAYCVPPCISSFENTEATHHIYWLAKCRRIRVTTSATLQFLNQSLSLMAFVRLVWSFVCTVALSRYILVVRYRG